MIIKTLLKLHPVSKEIFFHTGLSKTGSTFLQHQFFPRIENAYYMPTSRYRRAIPLIPRIANAKIIISREFDQQFENEIVKFSKHYPQAKPIIVFREPGSWAVSNYKRFVKNANDITFREFIDIQEDKGLFKIRDFEYSRYIQLLEENFEQDPLILMYEDLKINPEKFLLEICNYLEVDLNLNQVNLNPRHVSYDEKSLKLVRKLSKYLPFQKKLEIHRSPIGFLYNLYANILRYAILYGSKPFPETWFPKEPLINHEEVEAVSNRFKNEWEFVKAKAAENH